MKRTLFTTINPTDDSFSREGKREKEIREGRKERKKNNCF